MMLDIELFSDIESIAWASIVVLFMIPSFLTIFGILYHLNVKGSDYPNYLSIWRCFAYIADLVTDILVCILLAINQNKDTYFLFAGSFVFFAYILSNFACYYHIYKWSKHNIPYIYKYSYLVIMMSLLVGFYPAIDFLSSKLFYIKPFSMQLSYDQRHSLRKYRFINHVLLQNIPMITIQVLLIMDGNEDTIISMSLFFSMLSIFILLPKLLYRLRKNRQNSSLSKMQYVMEIISPNIRRHHQYCHLLLADTLQPFFVININRCETLSICSNADKTGIICNIQISSNQNEKSIDRMIHEITDNNSVNGNSFKQLLSKLMSLNSANDITINCRKSNGKLELSQMMQQQHHLNNPGGHQQVLSESRTNANQNLPEPSQNALSKDLSIKDVKHMLNAAFHPDEELSVDPTPDRPPVLNNHYSHPTQLNKSNKRKSLLMAQNNQALRNRLAVRDDLSAAVHPNANVLPQNGLIHPSQSLYNPSIMSSSWNALNFGVMGGRNRNGSAYEDSYNYLSMPQSMPQNKPDIYGHGTYSNVSLFNPDGSMRIGPPQQLYNNPSLTISAAPSTFHHQNSYQAPNLYDDQQPNLFEAQEMDEAQDKVNKLPEFDAPDVPKLEDPESYDAEELFQPTEEQNDQNQHIPQNNHHIIDIPDGGRGRSHTAGGPEPARFDSVEALGDAALGAHEVRQFMDPSNKDKINRERNVTVGAPGAPPKFHQTPKGDKKVRFPGAIGDEDDDEAPKKRTVLMGHQSMPLPRINVNNGHPQHPLHGMGLNHQYNSNIYVQRSPSPNHDASLPPSPNGDSNGIPRSSEGIRKSRMLAMKNKFGMSYHGVFRAQPPPILPPATNGRGSFIPKKQKLIDGHSGNVNNGMNGMPQSHPQHPSNNHSSSAFSMQDNDDAASEIDDEDDEDEANMVYMGDIDPDSIGGSPKIEESSTYSKNNDVHGFITPEHEQNIDTDDNVQEIVPQIPPPPPSGDQDPRHRIGVTQEIQLEYGKATDVINGKYNVRKTGWNNSKWIKSGKDYRINGKVHT